MCGMVAWMRVVGGGGGGGGGWVGGVGGGGGGGQYDSVLRSFIINHYKL